MHRFNEIMRWIAWKKTRGDLAINKKKKRNIHESALRRVRFPQLDWSLERQETSRVPQFHSSGNEDWDSNERSSNERDYEHAPSTIK